MKRLVATILILISVVLISTSCTPDKNGHYTEQRCDWCGKTEKCKLYYCQYLDDSFEFEYEFKRFSDSCYIKATNSGKWTNIKEG